MNVACVLTYIFIQYIIGRLLQYGLNEELLKKAFSQSVQGQKLCWSLKEIPTVGFYRELHNLLKKWPLSQSVTKTAIGKFYTCIDPELRRINTGDCEQPVNIYYFVEKTVLSNESSSMLMSYPTAIQHLEMEVSGCITQIQELSVKVRQQDEELSMMRREVELLLTELGQTKHVLKDIINELQVILQT